MASIAFVVGTGLSLVLNLVPSSTPVALANGSTTHTDGTLLRSAWLLRHYSLAHQAALADYQAGKYDAAVRGLRPFLASRRHQSDTISMVVSALVITKECDQARQILTTYRAQYQPTSNGWVNEGVLHAHFNELDAAFACYEQALQLDPANSFALNNRGYTHNRAGQYAQAVPDFRRALELNPGFAYAHANLGLALLMLGETDEGLGHVRYSLRLDDQNAYAYRNLGIYHLQRGELEEARRQLDRAWELDPHTDLLADYRAQLQSRFDGKPPSN
ncbi:tetratricopeptide repeat protein [Hymenobacter chitinivorans]|nr:tetratricopeptide repeat protein [Hymenobacter chitinivorans]